MERALTTRLRSFILTSQDSNYISFHPPVGWCKNRYCPEGAGPREPLVRGYCAECAAIRLPYWKAGEHEVDYSRVSWGSSAGMLKYEYG